MLHGPRRPRPVRFGLARLRRVLHLSAEVPSDQVADDAAAEIERLRRRAHRFPWDDDEPESGGF